MAVQKLACWLGPLLGQLVRSFIYKYLLTRNMIYDRIAICKDNSVSFVQSGSLIRQQLVVYSYTN